MKTTQGVNTIKVWINGEMVDEREARISVFDDGFLRGDALFDACRTFNGAVFQIEDHVDRFLSSCRFLDFHPPMDRQGLIQVGHEVAEINRHLVSTYTDFWVTYHITRGSHRIGFEAKPSFMVLCIPIPFKERAPLYREGISIIIPQTRRTPPWALSPRVKTHNYGNFVVAKQETEKLDPNAWPLLLDEFGNLCEGSGANIFLVKQGELLTPRETHVLPGISRQTVMELAAKADIPVRETNLAPRDLFDAEEIFLTSTSLCLCPVSRVNGREVKTKLYGQVTSQLLAAYNELAGLDIRAQYLKAE